MTGEGCALQILRAVGIGTQHLFQLLQPFGGQLPQTEVQFNQLTQQLRRHGHITEGFPGNIASSLHGPFRQARPGAHIAEGGAGGSWNAETTSPQALQQAAANTPSPGLGSYYGQAQAPSGGPWDSLVPRDLMPPPAGNAFATWTQGGSWNAEAQPRVIHSSEYPPDEYAYATGLQHHGWQPPEQDEESSSESCTSSDDGEEQLEGWPDMSTMTEPEASENIYFRYRNGRRMWRRFTGNPVRRFRRTFRRHLKKKGWGKSKGRGRGFF